MDITYIMNIILDLKIRDMVFTLKLHLIFVINTFKKKK